MAGWPASSARVDVGPPLSANGPSSRFVSEMTLCRGPGQATAAGRVQVVIVLRGDLAARAGIESVRNEIVRQQAVAQQQRALIVDAAALAAEIGLGSGQVASDGRSQDRGAGAGLNGNGAPIA